MENTVEKEVKSPCIRNCCLDGSDVCVGCGRRLDDIVNWQKLSSEEKQEVLVRSDLKLRGVN